MSRPPQTPRQPRRSGDPWHAISYLVTGVALYGLVGWLLDRWLGTALLLPLGIILGAALGVYLTWVRFRAAEHD